jgi:2-haloalkanoic acid dehalogenase type II
MSLSFFLIYGCDKMVEIKAVVFDFWDTLCPATIDFVHFKSLIKEQGIKMEDFIARYEKAVQTKNYDSFDKLRDDFFKEFSSLDQETLDKELYELYHNRFDKIYFFKNTKETLSKLREQGYKLGLMTNTESLHAKKIEEQLNLKKYFDFLGYSFEMNSIKPNPKVFEKVLLELKVKPNEALMVGDSLRSDIAGAKSVGMYSCYIERKIKHSVVNIVPDYKIHSIEEIFMVLGDLKSKSGESGE